MSIAPDFKLSDMVIYSCYLSWNGQLLYLCSTGKNLNGDCLHPFSVDKVVGGYMKSGPLRGDGVRRGIVGSGNGQRGEDESASSSLDGSLDGNSEGGAQARRRISKAKNRAVSVGEVDGRETDVEQQMVIGSKFETNDDVLGDDEVDAAVVAAMVMLNRVYGNVADGGVIRGRDTVRDHVSLESEDGGELGYADFGVDVAAMDVLDRGSSGGTYGYDDADDLVANSGYVSPSLSSSNLIEGGCDVDSDLDIYLTRDTGTEVISPEEREVLQAIMFLDKGDE